MMAPSFRKIDYSLRPAKQAERKMIAEIFRRLRPFGHVEDYTYVGFGSVWFSDFVLFHKALGIRDMISIEREAQAKNRIDANKPFASIRMEYKPAGAVLPHLDWTKGHLIWLDYDDPLHISMLSDVRSITTRATSGTVLAISTQSHAAIEVSQAEEDPSADALTRFRDAYGALVPTGTSGAQLYGWPFAKLSRDIFFDDIRSALVARNSGLTANQRLSFKSLCGFEYEDGVKMTTLVGVFVNENDLPNFEACKFAALDFLPSVGASVRIPFPKITHREARLIEQALPWPAGGPAQVGHIPLAESTDFATFYRYWPSYAVIES